MIAAGCFVRENVFEDVFQIAAGRGQVAMRVMPENLKQTVGIPMVENSTGKMILVSVVEDMGCKTETSWIFYRSGRLLQFETMKKCSGREQSEYATRVYYTEDQVPPSDREFREEKAGSLVFQSRKELTTSFSYAQTVSELEVELRALKKALQH